MANYIHREILCEAYSHLDVHVEPAKRQETEKWLAHYAQQRAQFLFGKGVRVKVEITEGSLKAKIIVLGSFAIALSNGISWYGSFRGGVDQLAKDASILAQATN